MSGSRAWASIPKASAPPATTEKAAPIPAEHASGVDIQRLADRCAQSVYSSIGKRDITRPIKEAIVDAILADRASQEERIREDEQDRLYEEAVRRMSEPDFMDDNEAAFVQRFLSRLGAMQPIDRARQRGDAS